MHILSFKSVVNVKMYRYAIKPDHCSKDVQLLIFFDNDPNLVTSLAKFRIKK